MRRFVYRRAALASALALLFSILCLRSYAQTSSGTISGQVLDPAGASVPNAAVLLVNALTGETRTGQSDMHGDFVFSSVQPGTFTIRVKASGFKALEKTGLMLSADERLSAGKLVLQVGTVSESVEVKAATTPVQTTSQERGGLLNDKQMQQLSTQGRDFMALLRLLPGVVGGEGGAALGTSGTPTINGVRSEYNLATIDGVVGNTRGLSTLDTPLNIDAIEQVKVLQANYQAEYGKTAGSMIMVVSKGGTQKYHGTAYYYDRNEAFNANNFFNNYNGVARPRYRYTTVGGNFGGPIYIPHKFNTSKDKLFFFFSEEYLPNKTPDGLKKYTTPTALERAGDFSQSLDVNNKLIPVKDPLTGAPFPGNALPSTRIDPNTQKLLNIFPQPNFLNRAISGGSYNYITSYTSDRPVQQNILRVDYNATEKLRTFFRGMNESVDNDGYSSPANKLPWLIPVDYKTHNPNVALNAVYIFSPTLVNELTVGTAFWTEDQGVTAADLAMINRGRLGIGLGQRFPLNNPLDLVPAASFGGIPNAASFGFDGRFPMQDVVTTISLTDGLTKTMGRHTMKFGVDLQGDQYLQEHHSGSSSFTGSFDFGRNTNDPFDTNYAYSNALLGVMNAYSEGTARLDYKPRTKVAEWYAQDNWKLSSKLTLDYGVRFTYDMAQTLKVGANFVPALYHRANAPLFYAPGKDARGKRVAVDPLSGVMFPAVYIGAFVPGVGNPANGTITTDNPQGYPASLLYGNGFLAAPRVGFAYDPFGDGKTAIRGGFGIFYNARARSGQEGDMTFNPPEIKNEQIYYANTQNYLNAGAIEFPSSVNHALETNPNMLASYNMSLGVQRSVGWGTVVDVAYVGTLGRHLSDVRNINELPYGTRFLPLSQDATTGKPLPDSFLAPYLGFGSIPMQYFDLNSSYNSLQAQVNHRFAHGLQFGASWTWSKYMDYTDSYNGTVAMYMNPRVWNYGESDEDRTHNLVINWLWDIPSPAKNIKAVNSVFGHWQVSGIASFISGSPRQVSFSTVDGTDITGGGDGARVVVTGPATLAKSDQTFYRFFNTSVFQRPAVGTTGNEPREVFRGPGTNDWDISLFKNVPIKEKATFQLRVESYNTFNHTQFSGVNASARFDLAGNQVNPLFGQFSSAAAARIMQMAVRVTF